MEESPWGRQPPASVLRLVGVSAPPLVPCPTSFTKRFDSINMGAHLTWTRPRKLAVGLDVPNNVTASADRVGQLEARRRARGDRHAL